MRWGRPGTNSQRGFTLVEALVAMAIASSITGAISTSIHQVFTSHAQSMAHMTAIKQVENAVFWLSRDVQQAQVVDPGPTSGFPLNLTWVDWDGVVEQVTYTLEGGELERAYSTGGAPVTHVVGRYIDSGSTETNFQFIDGVFTFKITASVGGSRPAFESRVGEIMPRAAQ